MVGVDRASRILGAMGVMTTGRMEAFSDAVIAIIITIMVLELRVPHEPSWGALAAVAPSLLFYLLSFVYLAIYWNNHHHMLHAVERVSGAALWANLHLLFWLSLVPFVTVWTGEHPLATVPTAVYGLVLLLAAVAYYLLQQQLIAADGPESRLRRAVGRDLKGRASPLAYGLAIAAALVGWSWLAYALYVAVALLWLVPDRRIEGVLTE